VQQLNFDSYYKHLAGKTIDWLPMDTEERYLSHLKNSYDILSENNWINNHFTYRFNSQGFRCNEFTDKENILFLGCSLTMGIGIPENTRWTNIVADTLNLECYNLGVGGSSLDTAFRLAYKYIDKLKPKLVIVRQPPGLRIELLNPEIFEKIENLTAMDSSHPYFKEFIKSEDNFEFNKLKNILAIEKLCQNNNIRCVIDSSNMIYLRNDLARDLMHPGIKTNQDYAKHILSLI